MNERIKQILARQAQWDGPVQGFLKIPSTQRHVRSAVRRLSKLAGLFLAIKVKGEPGRFLRCLP
jgi:hypothetical protein